LYEDEDDGSEAIIKTVTPLLTKALLSTNKQIASASTKQLKTLLSL
jgi:hypothetical protein